ncbi:MAG: hypothetical protein JW772_03520 [Candidatus Diapherotrites archaeon]|nr:hypothetical protein [Candidatus Diapherotrites archaeon]
MPRRRRRPPQHNIPGQRADFNIQGSKYRIRRQQDEFTIDGRPARGREINVEGHTTHIHVGEQRRRRTRQQIDFEARRRMIAEQIEAKQKYVQRLLKMPSTQQNVADRTNAFARKHHPVKAALSPMNPFKSTRGKLTAWYFHPITALGNLIATPRFMQRMGLGRKSRRSAIRDERNEYGAAATAFNTAGAGGEEGIRAFSQQGLPNIANTALRDYSASLNNAMHALETNRDLASFERSIADAETAFKREVQHGIIDYSRRKEHILGPKRRGARKIEPL